MKILIVEDDQKIANAIKNGLINQKYTAQAVYDADSALAELESGEFDLVILDRMLPGSTDGIGILKHLRSIQNNTPVLMLTAKDTIIDRAEGLNAGADDYLVKPFAFLELSARVRALLRRPKSVTSNILTCDDLSVDLDNFTVNRNQKNINLTALEFSLLEYFVRNQNRTLTKDQIIQSVWDYDADVLPNTVEVYVGYLRSKIDKAFPDSQPLIHTKRGFGYIFGVID